MANYGVFSVSQFAKLSRMTRDILHHYDRIGLLSPVLRGKNNYRYYSSDQLAIANFIRIQLETGTSLTEIKRIKDRRTPKSVNEALTRQLEQISAKIKILNDTQEVLSAFQRSIHSVLDIDEQAITVQFLPEALIVLGNANDYSKGRNDYAAYAALRSFYHDIDDMYVDVNLNYPIWALYTKERIISGDWNFPDRYYFYCPEGREKRPAAHYAIGYARGGYGQTEGLYRRLIDYIDQNGFEICGDAYEEYPLNEFCVADSGNYLIRAMITVREKTQA